MMRWLLYGFLFIHSAFAGSDLQSKFVTERNQMVDDQIIGRDVKDKDVIQAVRDVPRHLFVDEPYQSRAYGDHPLPIGEKQTISQPYMVAKMTELAHVKKDSKVLEIGTGSGYQAAVLAQLGAKVYSIEIIEKLSKKAKKNLDAAGFQKNVHLKVGDGYVGWKENAPFDAIIVTAAPEKVPSALKEQLAEGGKLVIPVGPTGGFFSSQVLMVLTKNKTGIEEKRHFPVAFVPMTGQAQKNDGK